MGFLGSAVCLWAREGVGNYLFQEGNWPHVVASAVSITAWEYETPPGSAGKCAVVDYNFCYGLRTKGYGHIVAIFGIFPCSQLLQSGGFPSRWSPSWRRTGVRGP